MATTTVVATATKVQGEVFAINASGVRRRLREGDAILEGETVVTAAGSSVVLAFANGNAVTVPQQQTVVVDTSVGGDGRPDTTTAGLTGAPRVITPGTDPNQLLEEEAAAAGLAGTGGDSGSSFVMLMRLAELGGPGNVYGFGVNTPGGLTFIDGGAVPDPGLVTPATPPVTPVAAADDANAVSEGGGAIAGGVVANDTGAGPLTVTSVRTGTEAAGAGTPGTVGSPLNGTYGTLDLGSNGTYTYTLNNADPRVQLLAPGETLTDTFSYVVGDGTSEDRAEIVITITGTEDLPIAVADTAAINEDTANVSGTVRPNDTPGDGTLAQNVFALTSSATGTYGSLVINADGSYVYTLNNASPTVQNLAANATVTDTFTYSLTDSDGDTSSANLVITITGMNELPIANNDSTFVRERPSDGDFNPRESVNGNVLVTTAYPNSPDQTLYGDVADSDPDGGTLSVTGGTFAGTYGTLTLLDNGRYRYELTGTLPQSVDSDTFVTETFNYTLNDGQGGSSVGTLTVALYGQNDPPTAANDQNQVTFGERTKEPESSGGGDDTFAPTVDTATGNVLLTMDHGSLFVAGSDTPVAFGDRADTDPDIGETARLQLTNVGGIDFGSNSEIVVTGQYGELTIQSDGDYTYRYTGGGGGTFNETMEGGQNNESFTYTITDGDATASATLTILINNGPRADDDSNLYVSGGGFLSDTDGGEGGNVVSSNEQHSGGPPFITIPTRDDADFDPNNDILRVVGLRAGAEDGIATSGNVGTLTTLGPAVQGQFGTLQIESDGDYRWTYTGDPGGSGGTDVFQYTISDGMLTDTGEIRIVVTQTGGGDS